MHSVFLMCFIFFISFSITAQEQEPAVQKEQQNEQQNETQVRVSSSSNLTNTNTANFGASSNADNTSNALLVKTLEKILKDQSIPKSHLGIYITDFSGKKVFALNEEKDMTPASLTKIVTAAAVLNKFPPGHRFITKILGDQQSGAQLDQGTIGRLCLKGGGDPSFVSENMWFLVNHFLRTGIKNIQGPIIVDDSLFDDVRFDHGRDQERVSRAYDAPIGALSMNWNSVNVFIRPSTKVGELSRVVLDPETTYVSLVNRVKTVKSGHTVQIDVRRISEDGKIPEIIEVRGQIPLNHDEIAKYINIIHPNLWTGYNLLSFLKQRGIHVANQSVIKGVCPTSPKILAQVESKALQEILSDMLKFSNNYVAEMLTKNLAVDDTNQKEKISMPQGLEEIRNFLNEIGIQRNRYNLQSPSGLSRKNRFHPTDLVKVLLFVQKHFSIAPEYLVALPIAGVDGTLKRRMKNEDDTGSIRAKTGLITGVVGLGGYVGRKNGQQWTFAFLHNGPESGSEARTLFDKLALTLAKF